MQNTWFTSDTHAHHKNIVAGVAEWEDKSKCRPFETLEEHDEALIHNINACVQEDDVLYHLGDWSFGGFDQIRKFRERLNCKTIHLIFGNHDHHIERNREGVQSLFASVQHYKEVPIGKRKIILCHYAMRVWNGSHKGNWMLYGHSHGTLDEMRPEFANPNLIGDQYYIKNYRTMDVGIDTHPQFRPYAFEEIRDIMERREILLDVDHHGVNTVQ